MAVQNFEKSLGLVLKHEGGYVDHPRDPGGATNKGVTIGTLGDWLGRKATKEEVRNISDETVAAIYKRNYWDKVRGNDLPAGFDYVAFDGGVNSGPSRGVRWLQKGLKVSADGRIGPQTMDAALKVRDGVAVIQRACAARLGFMQGLRTWKTFGRGWGRRVAGVEAEAVAMYTQRADLVEVEATKATAAKHARTRDAAGGAAGGGASTLADLPDLVTYGIVGLAVVIAVVMIQKATQNARRSAAYRAKALELKNEN